MGGQREAGTEVLGFADRFQALDRIAGHRLGMRGQQVGVGLVMRAPDAPTQLVQLGQTELVGALDFAIKNDYPARGEYTGAV